MSINEYEIYHKGVFTWLIQSKVAFNTAILFIFCKLLDVLLLSWWWLLLPIGWFLFSFAGMNHYYNKSPEFNIRYKDDSPTIDIIYPGTGEITKE